MAFRIRLKKVFRYFAYIGKHWLLLLSFGSGSLRILALPGQVQKLKQWLVKKLDLISKVSLRAWPSNLSMWGLGMAICTTQKNVSKGRFWDLKCLGFGYFFISIS